MGFLHSLIKVLLLTVPVLTLLAARPPAQGVTTAALSGTFTGDCTAVEGPSSR